MTSGARGAVTWSCARDGLTVRLTGEIDGSNDEAVQERLLAEVGAGASTVDLSSVRFCSASGVRAVLEAHAVRRRDGGRTVVRCTPLTARVFAACRAERVDGLVIEVCEDEPGGGGWWADGR